MTTPRRPVLAPRGDARASEPAPPNPARASAPPRLHSDALFGNHDVVLIQHAGETYRLQRTRLGKLILTK